MHLHILTTSQQIVKHSAKTSDDCQRNNSHNHDDHQTSWNDCCQNRRQRIGYSRLDVKFIIHANHPRSILVTRIHRYSDDFHKFLKTTSICQKRGWEKTLSQIEKPDQICNQLQIWSGFFAYAWQSSSMMEITQNSLAVNLTESLARWFIRRCIWQNHCRLRTHRWKWAFCP